MSFVLTEEQEILRKTARDFVGGAAALARMRALRDAEEGPGHAPDVWRKMAELGWTGIVIPEQYGGLGMGWSDLMVVLEELGRGLAPEPVMGTLLLGATALVLGGTEAQKTAHLPAVAAGERLLAVAWQEPGSRYEVDRMEARADRAGSGWRIAGEKVHVLDGHVADWFVVAGRTAGGVTLFLVARDAPGVAVERQRRVDARGAAIVRFDNVTVSADAVLGTEGEGAALLGRVVDRATIGMTAEMLGGMCAAFEMTLDYLKTRQQFGVPIGSFQALKHRAARCFVETELARSVVMAAHQALDEGADDARVARLASVAKARLSDAYLAIANEGIQMHGGIGMTDEHDIGFFLKRARAAELTFGDAAWHRNRIATLDGY